MLSALKAFSYLIFLITLGGSVGGTVDCLLQQPVWLFLKSRDACTWLRASQSRPPAAGVDSDWSKLGNPILLPVIGSGIQAQANQLQASPQGMLLSLKLDQLDWRIGILVHDLGAEREGEGGRGESLLLSWIWTTRHAGLSYHEKSSNSHKRTATLALKNKVSGSSIQLQD